MKTSIVNNQYTQIQSTENEFLDFQEAFSKEQNTLLSKNVILEFSENINISFDQISLYLDNAQAHRNNNTSFVVVCKKFDVEAFPEDFNIVPTLTEAIDIIEMEAIERDLGL